MASQPALASKGTYRRAPEEKRELLLSAARSLFSAQGFKETSTAQIAERAGVSEGVLFHHFGSKRNLFDCVADAFVAEGVRTSVDGDLSEMTPESVVRASFDFCDTDPGLYQEIAQIGEINDFDRRTVRLNVVVRAITQQLQEAMAQGRARQGDAQVMGELQFALVDGAYKAWRRSGQPEARETYIQEAAYAMRMMSAPVAEAGKDGASNA
ncbi:MAG: TetR/AcrR family transcriptional regulator [Pseudomonadaceae bacterium]|nr:TetR/AcrR family transcriptional regulator [Pseudomonadaceae bacterium]